MRYAKNILETIGNTPLVKLNKVNKGLKPTILLKLEYFNPGGSIKDRIGITMIEDAESKGLLKPGGTIIEPTSGNTGVGLALAAIIKGYKVIFLMPDKMSAEKENILKAYGAKVIRTPSNVKPEDPRSNINLAKKLSKEIPNSYVPMQYENSANPKAHFQNTGPEIYRDTDGKITHLVAGLGTGGTITGIAKYLKMKKPEIKIIGVDPEGSIYHHTFYKTAGSIHQYKTEGIGEDFIPKAVDLTVIDDIEVVDDKETFLMAREIVSREGLLIGGSGAAAVVGALRIAKRLSKKDVIVVVVPDSGRSYISRIYNDNWMKENKYL